MDTESTCAAASRHADRDGPQLFEGGQSSPGGLELTLCGLELTLCGVELTLCAFELSPKFLKRDLRIIQRLPRFHQGTLRLIESGPGSVQGNLCSSAPFLARLERVAKFLNGSIVLVLLELVEDVRRHAEQR